MYVSDEFFDINYNEKLDRLEVEKKKKSILTKHRILTMLSMLFIALSLTNCVLVYTFMEILKSI